MSNFQIVGIDYKNEIIVRFPNDSLSDATMQQIKLIGIVNSEDQIIGTFIGENDYEHALIACRALNKVYK